MTTIQRRPAEPLFFSAFLQNTVSHLQHGAWTLPEAEQTRMNELDLWVDLARTLEAGGFDMMFFADMTGLVHDFAGGIEKFVTAGLHIPCNDPMVIVSAMAAATQRLGLAFTSSILQLHPFEFARKISTLDHATRGRIGWNVVTGMSDNASRNFGLDELIAHDERYEWAEEYMEVVYKLWQASWDDEALLLDKSAGVVADAAHVHRIDHKGPRYSVQGPHLVSPSPQRVPFLFQAGASARGRDFAAKHAEVVFLLAPTPAVAARDAADVRRRAEACGRDPRDIKILQGLTFVVGETHEAAEAEAARLDATLDDAAYVAFAGGIMGVDLGFADLDQPISDLRQAGTESVVAWLQQAIPDGKPTVRDIARIHRSAGRIVGTPEEIADAVQVWADAGIDGINIINYTIPGSYQQVIESVMPELRRRGLARDLDDEPPVTFRARFTGSDRPDERHPAHAYLRSLGAAQEEQR
ncbi:NtaA/DmoA family FMN-dependent monooxygenase [Nocardia sp. NPDC088792]|uniref:NtaA/DmoA family FMN-dependent monooxygenase n=1 Tax=Nocardia sp. NPDC088792 TaxID=3364332 RepID=UPI00382D2D79